MGTSKVIIVRGATMSSFILPLLLLILSRTNAQHGKKNIIFLLADDLGYNDVSWHNPDVLTPNLQRLAGRGLILENNYVQTNCGPSRNALMTGHYPSVTGGQFVSLRTLEPLGVPTKFKFLPQFMKDAGYNTHGIGKWHLGFCHPDYLPHNRGFDTYNGFWNGATSHFNHTLSANPSSNVSTSGYDFHFNDELDLTAFGKSTSEIIGERVLEIIDEDINMTAPFFVYAAFADPHIPLEIEPRFTDLYPNITDPIRKRYLGMVSRLDETVGKIVNKLESVYFSDETTGETKTMLENTIIVFSSDNGGWSDEFGYSGGSNLPLRGSKVDLWEGGTRVPGFVYNIGREGETSAELFHITDWLPTLYAGVAGGNMADLPSTMSGYNQIDVLTDQTAASPREEVLYDIGNFQNTTDMIFIFGDHAPADLDWSGSFGAAYRFKDWKIILGCHTFVGCANNYGLYQLPNSIMLFNLADDPNETTNLVNEPEYAATLKDLRDRFQVHYDQAVQPWRAPEDFDGGMPTLQQPPSYFTDWCESIYDPFAVSSN